jgi:putative hydrolase of HD superfamily
MTDIHKNFFEFLKIAEKLKGELRHSWVSRSGRQESVAEHMWMMALSAFVLMEESKLRLDKLKVLKMILIHDLGEAIIGDIPSHEISKRNANKAAKEKKAIEKISKVLGKNKAAREIRNLFQEFEEQKTREAKFVYAVDKFECLVQHNLADIKTWDDADYRYTLVEKQDTPFDFDPFMRNLKNQLDVWTIDKVKKAKTLKKVPKENMARYRGK